jgi:hypothetical protein
MKEERVNLTAIPIAAYLIVGPKLGKEPPPRATLLIWFQRYQTNPAVAKGSIINKLRAA